MSSGLKVGMAERRVSTNSVRSSCLGTKYARKDLATDLDLFLTSSTIRDANSEIVLALSSAGTLLQLSPVNLYYR